MAGGARRERGGERRLHELLVRAVRGEVSRRSGQLRVSGAELDDLAHQAAADAMVAVLGKLATFRGESRFTTWVQVRDVRGLGEDRPPPRAAFDVLTNAPDGNAVAAYDEALRPAGTYVTGGNGGALTGAAVDRLASQGALTLDRSRGLLLYAVNAGSGTVSGYRSGRDGLTAAGTTPTDPGTVDAAAASDGRRLYVQTGRDGNVDAYRIHADGSLSAAGSVTVPGAYGGEGIAAG